MFRKIVFVYTMQVQNDMFQLKWLSLKPGRYILKTRCYGKIAVLFFEDIYIFNRRETLDVRLCCAVVCVPVCGLRLVIFTKGNTFGHFLQNAPHRRSHYMMPPRASVLCYILALRDFNANDFRKKNLQYPTI